MKYWRRPLDIDQVRIPRGTVHIIVDRCKGCAFCVEYCPKDVLAMSEEFNEKGYHPPMVVKAEECVACNLCEMICPDFAIYSIQTDGASLAGDEAGPDETRVAVKDGVEEERRSRVES